MGDKRNQTKQMCVMSVTNPREQDESGQGSEKVFLERRDLSKSQGREGAIEREGREECSRQRDSKCKGPEAGASLVY